MTPVGTLQKNKNSRSCSHHVVGGFHVANLRGPDIVRSNKLLGNGRSTMQVRSHQDFVDCGARQDPMIRSL